jgi:hypothetical protein
MIENILVQKINPLNEKFLHYIYKENAFEDCQQNLKKAYENEVIKLDEFLNVYAKTLPV